MKVKLRDLTLKQFEEWKENECDCICGHCPFKGANCDFRGFECWIFNEDMFSDKFLDQEIEIDCEAILTEEEREYLSNVIKPFRDRVEYIEKYKSINGYHFLGAFNDSDNKFIFKICLFSKEEYKGLELYKRYTLEELGL